MDRRRFLQVTIASGASASSSRMFGSIKLLADTSGPLVAPNYEIEERIAAGPATFYRPYCSKPVGKSDAVTWIQVDLGSRLALDAIRLYPSAGVEGENWPYPYNFGTFPLRFKIEISDYPDCSKASLIADCTHYDYPDPKNQVAECPAQGEKGRYVRLTVTQMRPIPKSATFAFALTKLAVLFAGKDIAERCTVTGDSVSVNDDDLLQITRPPRPQGEGIVTDHPENVIPASNWKSVEYKARAPITGVTLNGGLFQTVLENNIGYLLDSFSVDELLRQFRERAGRPSPQI